MEDDRDKKPNDQQDKPKPEDYVDHFTEGLDFSERPVKPAKEKGTQE